MFSFGCLCRCFDMIVYDILDNFTGCLEVFSHTWQKTEKSMFKTSEVNINLEWSKMERKEKKNWVSNIKYYWNNYKIVPLVINIFLTNKSFICSMCLTHTHTPVFDNIFYWDNWKLIYRKRKMFKIRNYVASYIYFIFSA